MILCSRGLPLVLFDWVCKRYSFCLSFHEGFGVFFRAEELEELRGEKLDERQVLRLFKQLSTKISDSNWVRKCLRENFGPQKLQPAPTPSRKLIIFDEQFINIEKITRNKEFWNP